MAPSSIKRLIVVLLVPALIVDPALAGVFTSRHLPSPSTSLFIEQAFMLRIVEMIRPLGQFMPVRGTMTEMTKLASAGLMADRFGAYRTPRPARKPQVRGEISEKELEQARERAKQLFPALKPILETITRGSYAAPVSLPGAVPIRKHPEQPGDWELLVDDRYKGLPQDLRIIFLLFHLIPEAAELSTPSGPLLVPEINNELIGMILQGQVYSSLSPNEQESLLIQAKALDALEPNDPDRFYPVL